MKCYSDLIRLKTFKERYDYLKLLGSVGNETFGFLRFLNQTLYSSSEWKTTRRDIIIRDKACDMAVEGRLIDRYIVVHHINPISVKDIQNRDPKIFDPENLICVSKRTHNAIHYGDEDLLFLGLTERYPGDTCLWR